MNTVWWYMSFTDDTRPKGSQFLGAALVLAVTLEEAIRASWTLGCNPGGAVMAVPLPVGARPDPAFCNRLLTREEAEGMPEPAEMA